MSTLTDRLSHLVKKFADGKHTIFARNAGIKPSTFQYYIKGRAPNSDTLSAICETYNVNANWLLTGKGEILLQDEPIDHEEDNAINMIDRDQVVLEHIEIVKKFEDKERAKNINKNLITIERESRKAFLKIETYIEGVANGISIMKEDMSSGSSKPESDKTPKKRNRA